ncbi:MAG TPA: helix-turn-helix domain-containing protein [Verrucomicrobiae bacterium]|nr:helix-turn-helix domain-containing protein [Verrucomicrobiae bacterium]
MRPRGSQTALEERRRLGIGLLRQGLSLDEVSRRVGCHASSVFRWREAFRQNGRSGLKARPIPGRPRKLVARDLRRLVRLLNEGPRAHGYKTDYWTTMRIAKLIRRQFGVRYHRDHIGRLMATLDWQYVKPLEEQATRSTECRDGAEQAWQVHGWVPRCRG